MTRFFEVARRHWLLVSFVTLVSVLLLIWQCGMRVFMISGSSNFPTMRTGDIVAVNLTSYGLSPPLADRQLVRWDEPQRGDLILFAPPATHEPEPDQTQHFGTQPPMIKRVVAVPGDIVELRVNRLYVNDDPLLYTIQRKMPMTSDPWDADTLFVATEHGNGPDRSIAIRSDCDPKRCSFGPVTLTNDHYFVLGDNRDFSADSRHFGPVPRNHIRGRFAGHIRHRTN
ncbi:MAG: signal peptidase I [bacterium]|nr:signal peptidase I [bacterium]